MNSNNQLVGIFASDFHFGGHSNLENFKKETDFFIDFVKKNLNELDMVVLGGDLFDRVLNFKEPAGKLVSSFFLQLYELLVKNEKYLLYVNGTISHDNNQIYVFQEYLNNYFRIYSNLTIDTLFMLENDESLNFLFIPEEYPKDKDIYFELIKEECEKYVPVMAFGHGTFDFTSFESQKIMSEKQLNTAPIFDSEFMSSLVSGQILFGHIHSPLEWKNKIIYANSFSRNCFGEEEDKGFLIFYIDIENKTTETKRVINIYAPEYKTIDLSDYEFEKMPVEEKIKFIKKQKEIYPNLRIIDTKNVSSVDSQILQSAFKFDNNIKIESNYKRVKKEVSEEDEKFDFVLKRSLPFPEIVQKFIKISYNKDLSLKEIEEILSETKKDK
jgi:DNA repair exonuclease SbcCD nuclease subunit